MQYLKGCSIGDTDLAIDAQYLKPASGSSQNGLTAEYFNNETLSGTPVLTQVDYDIDFNWDEASPNEFVGEDNFSVRWSGVLIPPQTRTYEITVKSDDGFRLYIDGTIVLQDWTVHSERTDTVSMTLNAGHEYDIVLEYFESEGEAVIKLGWDYETTDFSSVAALAAASDVAIVCVGTDMDIADEGNDMDQYQMPGLQEEMLQAIYAANPNTIVVLINGNPIGFEWTAENIPAILEAWYAGQSQGTAIADVLFGDYNPGGRLSQTFYKSESQLPAIYDYDIINGGRTYQYFGGDVQYPFGHGLSYTQFEYFNINVTPTATQPDGQVVVSVDVENTGSLDCDEVIQLYVKDMAAMYKNPIHTLKDFKRVSLEQGEKTTQTFILNAEDLAYYDTALNDFKVELGQFEIQVGSSSADIRQTASIWVTDTANGDLSGNGKVDLEDLAILASLWLSSLDEDTLEDISSNWLEIQSAVFTSNPVVELNAVEDVAYSSTLSDDVVYYDIDQLVFSKLTGPTWLTVDTNGSLMGTPSSSDVGDNIFTVQVDDHINDPVQASVQITVEEAIFSLVGVINVNFVKTGYTNTEAGQGALEIGASVWNVFVADQDQSSLGVVALTNVVDSKGTETTVDIVYDCQSRGAWISNGVQSSSLSSTTGQHMMQSYFTTQNAANYVYLQGLEAGSYYDLYLFGHGDDETQNTIFNVNGTTKQSTIDVDGLTVLTENSHYVIFKGIAADQNGEIQIQFSNGSANQWGAFNGVQIVSNP